jgi:ankyrin repeat protein
MYGLPRPAVPTGLVTLALAASVDCVPPRSCAKPPSAVVSWASGYHVRHDTDRAVLERYLSNHPRAVNSQYGFQCETLLHTAVALGRDDLVPPLLDRGADLGAHDRQRRTVLDAAAAAGRASVVALLLAKGADPNARASEEPPLYYAVTVLPGAASVTARFETTALLLKAGADVNAKGRDGRTTLFRALGPAVAGDDNGPVIELLLAHGADVRARDNQGGSTLEYAVSSGGSRRVVELLLDHGAEPIAPPGDAAALGGALSAAAFGGRVEIATLLIERGADLNWRYAGPLPLEWRSLPLAVALVVAPAEDRGTAARRREVAALLLARGADVTARNAAGETILHAVASAGDLPAIDLLLSHGADVGAADRSGFTALHRAVQHGRVAAAAALIASGADAQARADDGSTPIDLAANDGEMQALLRHHAAR